MSLFRNYSNEARQIELEIERKGIVLGIDWGNEAQVRAVAHKALVGTPEDTNVEFHDLSWNDKAMIELIALSQLMLAVMRQSASEDLQTHGGRVWTSFGRALMIEATTLGLIGGD